VFAPCASAVQIHVHSLSLSYAQGPHRIDEHSEPALFRDALDRLLEPHEALSRIRLCAGLIPVVIDTGYRGIWLDVADHPLVEWKLRFDAGINDAIALQQADA